MVWCRIFGHLTMPSIKVPMCTSLRVSWGHLICCLVLSCTFLWLAALSEVGHLLSFWDSVGNVVRSPSLPLLASHHYICMWKSPLTRTLTWISKHLCMRIVMKCNCMEEYIHVCSSTIWEVGYHEYIHVYNTIKKVLVQERQSKKLEVYLIENVKQK